jgi:hypothetical protein
MKKIAWSSIVKSRVENCWMSSHKIWHMQTHVAELVTLREVACQETKFLLLGLVLVDVFVLVVF